MSVTVKVTGGLNIEWGQIDPKTTGGLRHFFHFYIWKKIEGCSNLILH